VIDRRTFLAGGLGLAAACRPRRGAGFPGYAFVANEEGQAIAVVDLTAFAVAGTSGANPPSDAHRRGRRVCAHAAHGVCSDVGALASGRKKVCANVMVSMR
jgi:hypothetical protein